MKTITIEYAHALDDHYQWWMEQIPSRGWQKRVDQLIDLGYVVRIQNKEKDGTRQVDRSR